MHMVLLSRSYPLSATSSDVVLSNTSTVVSPVSDDGFDRLKDDDDDCNDDNSSDDSNIKPSLVLSV